MPRPALGLAALLLAGCGAAPTVSGTVTLDDQPVSSGTVSVAPADGAGPSTGAEIVNGKFTLPAGPALTPGKKKVTVLAVMKTGKQVPAGPPAAPGTMIDEIVPFPPAGAPAEVREVEFKPGPNDLNVALSSKKK